MTGAQNVWYEPDGAFTGEVSANMVATLGAELALVGHSERRAMFGDSDEVVAMKFKKISDAGLVPLLCVGETLEERESDLALEAVQRQLTAVENAWDRRFTRTKRLHTNLYGLSERVRLRPQK